jgi:hypothetical protein
MAEQTHPCPGGCRAEIPHHQLSCKPCWFRLPKPLRDDVNSAYRKRRAEPLGHARAVSAASRWYRANPQEPPS